MTILNRRQHRLWAALCDRETVTTGDVHTANREIGAEDPSMWAPKRTTARRDCDDFVCAGLFVEHGPANGRWYQPTAVAS